MEVCKRPGAAGEGGVVSRREWSELFTESEAVNTLMSKGSVNIAIVTVVEICSSREPSTIPGFGAGPGGGGTSTRSELVTRIVLVTSTL